MVKFDTYHQAYLLILSNRLTAYFEGGLFSDRFETVIRKSAGPPRESDDPCESSIVQKDQNVEYADIKYKNVKRLNKYMMILMIFSTIVLLYEKFINIDKQLVPRV